MTKLEELKLRMFQNKYGVMTSNEALECAMLDDGIARDLATHDPAKARFWHSAHDMLSYAELLEKKEVSNAVQ